MDQAGRGLNEGEARAMAQGLAGWIVPPSPPRFRCLLASTRMPYRLVISCVPPPLEMQKTRIHGRESDPKRKKGRIY